MKKMIFVMLALVFGCVLSAMPFDDIFTVKGNFSKWQQTTSGYYQPLGKVSENTEGLVLASNNKTDITLSRKEHFPVKVGDKVEITMTFSCPKDCYTYLGLYEYNKKGWTKNDIAAFWLKPNMTSITKVITVSGGNDINAASVCFGIGKEKTLVVKSISAKILNK